MVFSRDHEVRWADIDANFHLRHSVYADLCATLRMQCLSEFGFSLQDLIQVKMGPILFKETLKYLREVPPGEILKVTMRIGGASEDGRKWRICHEIIRNSDGIKAAEVEVDGAWMSTELRKITAPPEKLRKVFQSLDKTDDFKTL